jgi:hypothetical protein
VIVTFPAERVMAALPPVGDKVSLQPGMASAQSASQNYAR